jgi:uncharacterized protein YdhG (YjbR/CyaY superfamily)
MKGVMMKSKSETPKNIDEYIAACAPDVQEILQKIRATIRLAAPDAQEKISYAMPCFAQQGNLVYFAAWKSHIGFYPSGSGIAQFEKDLFAYEGAKGSVQFPFDKPIPYNLISQITKFRVAENLAKAAAKKKK